MEELVKIVSDWPLIIQGALGSGLFWLILLIGQKVSAKLANAFSSYSSKAKEEQLNIQWQKYAGLKAHYDGDKQLSTNFQVGLLYQASRSFFTGLIWFALGLIFNSFIPILGIVGYLGFIFYLFKSLGCVQRIDKSLAPEEKLTEISEQLKKIQLNKQRQSDG